MSAPFATRSVRSRVVVAGEAPVMPEYLPALRPPLNPSGPSRSIRSNTFSWRSLSRPRRRSSSRVLSMRNSTRAIVRRWASIAVAANQRSHAVISVCLFAASSASLILLAPGEDSRRRSDERRLTPALCQRFFGNRPGKAAVPVLEGMNGDEIGCAIPALVRFGSGSPLPGAVRLNQLMKPLISCGIADEGGASKCTRGAWMAPDTTCIGCSSARSPSFGSQNIGTTSGALTTTLSNPGTDVLSIASITVVGADASEFTITANTCPASLAPKDRAPFRLPSRRPLPATAAPGSRSPTMPTT